MGESGAPDEADAVEYEELEDKHARLALRGAHSDSGGDLTTRPGPLPSSSSSSSNGTIPGTRAPAELENAYSQADAKTVSWRDLPRKDQLIVITLARLSEPLVQTSLQSYMFYQLKWFDPSLPDSIISSQAGILQYVSSSDPLLLSSTGL